MEIWAICLLLLLLACCWLSLVGASLAAFGLGLRGIVSRLRSADSGEEGAVPRRRSLIGPILLMAGGGLGLFLIAYGTWKTNHDRRQKEEAHEIIMCQEAFLAEHYRISFVQRRGGELEVGLEEFSIEGGHTETPVSGIVQFDVVDHYMLGEEDDGYWFLVDLALEDSSRYFSSRDDLFEEVANLSLSSEPEPMMASQYCELNDCQPCSTWPYVTPTPP
jgi:hypothetical protein